MCVGGEQGISALTIALLGGKDSVHSTTAPKKVERRADGQGGAERQTDSHRDCHSVTETL